MLSLMQMKQSLTQGGERSDLDSPEFPGGTDDEEAGPLQTLGKALADVFGLGSHSFDGDDSDTLDATKESGADQDDELLDKIRKKKVSIHSSVHMLSEDVVRSQNKKATESAISMSRATRKLESGITMNVTRYLDLVRDTITGAQSKTPIVKDYLGHEPKEYAPFDGSSRWRGETWCDFCFSMAGGARVQNVRELVERTIANGVGGDFLEAGTWRGGNSIMARVVQQIMGEGDTRHTYVCDSFSGLPKSSQERDTDQWSDESFLEVSQEQVADNFKRFNALDDHVHFRKGYFSDSLPKLREELAQQGRSLAVLRGDGDMYESYMDILYNLYDSVSVGGYFICDDCPTMASAQEAIDDFRKQNGITEPIQRVNGSAFGSFWQKESPARVRYETYLKWNKTRTFRGLL
jgi:hypothetical protein